MRAVASNQCWCEGEPVQVTGWGWEGWVSFEYIISAFSIRKSTFYRGYNIEQFIKLILTFVNFYLKNLHTMYVSLCT